MSIPKIDKMQSGALDQVQVAPSGFNILSTNFLVSAIVLVGSIFTWWNFSESQVTVAVTQLLGVVSFVALIREQIKATGLKVDLRKWLATANPLHYIGQILLAIGVSLPPELLPSLKTLVDALQTGNWGQVISAGLALITILYHIFRK
ncbi:MAG: hypothetical protein ACRCVX_14150 [Shewanella sp.]